MTEEYVKKRKQVRLNVIVASLFCFVAVAMSIMYGASFLSVYWAMGNIPIAVASFIGAMALAVLIMGLWLRIILKLKKKLQDMQGDKPKFAVSA